jgi:2-phospho-L-lactate guanylyltransferase (CobY/MobA/RfbA family)
MLDAAVNGPVVAINPDRHKKGTNALLVSPTGLIKYAFGEDSFQVHCQRAQAAGARLEILDHPGLALDLDLPEDLALIQQEMQVLNVSSEISLLAESGFDHELVEKSCVKKTSIPKLTDKTTSTELSSNPPVNAPKMNSE